MHLVWENAPCRENSLLILLALADWANDDGVCWPSMQKLADKARVDRRSAQRIVRKLVQQRLISIDEGGGRANQHQYTVERAALCRPLENGDIQNSDIGDTERATLGTERATFPTQRATPVSPDPLVDPLDHDPSVDPPYAGSAFSEALAAFERQRTKMRKPITPDARRLLYRKLSDWGEDVATRALEDAVINRWQGVFEPRQNGNGKGHLPKAEASVQAGKEWLAAKKREIENGRSRN